MWLEQARLRAITAVLFCKLEGFNKVVLLCAWENSIAARFEGTVP